MPQVTPTSFWAALAIIATAAGGLFSMQVSHANENGHSKTADQAEVSEVRIRLERVATEVEHHTQMLDELKIDLREVSRLQADSSREILEAIRGN